MRSKLLLTGVMLAFLTGCATRSNAPLPTLLPANLTQPCNPFQPPTLVTNSDVER